MTALRASLADVLEGGATVGAFTCYDLEQIVAVAAAAEARHAPVVLLISDQAFRRPSGPSLLAALVAMAERAPGPVCVQLDHVDDLDRIAAALDSGAGAVMADGSRLPYDDNVAFTTQAVRMAAGYAADVEAELGRVEGDEDVAAAALAGALTDPGQAGDFVRRTGVACLAVSIGNTHGAYAEPPQLDWPRLAAIRAAVAVPLALHGASGLSRPALARAVAGGARKVNVNTELRQRHLAALEAALPDARTGADLLGLQEAVIRAVAETVGEKLDQLAAAERL